jgi:hypothetical protein
MGFQRRGIGRLGQFYSVDFAISAILFTFVVAVSILVWDNLNYEMDSKARSEFLQTKIVSSSTILLETQGYPSNWTSYVPSNLDKIGQIGLASGSNVLSSDKVAAFVSMNGTNYSTVSSIFGIGPEKLYIRFVALNGSTMSFKGKAAAFGFPPMASAASVSAIRRPVVVTDSATGAQITGRMELMIW